MKFVVKGLQGTGDVVRLTVEASDAADARRVAGGQGLNVLAVTAQNPLVGWLPKPRVAFALDLFGQELVSLLESGLSLVEAVETLAEKAEQRAAADALNEVRGHLLRGQNFSYALEQQPAFFPPLFVATVRAAEKSGDIREAIARFLEYHEQLDRIRRKLVSAAVYPLMLMGVGLLVTGFLLFYVVPKFSRIYEELGSEMPFLTRVLINWGSALEAHATVTLLGLAALAGVVAWGVTRPALRRWVAPRLWAMPAVGNRMRIYQLARFYRNLGMLLKSGIPMPTALDMAGGLLSPYLRAGLEKAAREVREGLPVSRAFQKQGLTTPVSLRLLGVGERSGRMPYTVERIAVFYEDDLARWVDWFTRLFEPALMVVIGGIVGLIVVLLYLPIFELAENIK
ncbi:Type II secretion system protein [Rubrivivax sp. A210]|uniref:type II secretion system F family protein n=1 Tax=Rubrivivax sp. A210 TaxID=2772301 RepID=UPI00191A2E60|nr:type II secretion system F family protein [Rubrivivax sp. A210]CAD5369848.1 Type II secretion system protein [Rubrivivax sp. A210]